MVESVPFNTTLLLIVDLMSYLFDYPIMSLQQYIMDNVILCTELWPQFTTNDTLNTIIEDATRPGFGFLLVNEGHFRSQDLQCAKPNRWFKPKQIPLYLT